ncbi:class II fructose-bisphosphatase [Salibacterium halotolerans]|uniref:Fructose-1,6-bisphosphatase n=1 Tax=Salibacterium halotolerans TaxID=1884432 RepID=A0A1I5PNG7_9BACI|nr:class II fructose-bisphosphatase [Salibacterium halotolerans]SFP35330.1 fructose-1,6-bisphosphatase II [Salibacterium halotolerans]
MKDIAMSFLSVTEKAAAEVYPYIGKGDKMTADEQATKAMRAELNQQPYTSRVVIGEGEMDEAPMLYIGEVLGNKGTASIDLAVDPIDGTTSVAQGRGNTIAVLAGAPKGKLLHAPDMYMKKIAVGPKAAGAVHVEKPLDENIEAAAKALGKDISEMNIMVQDRKRHHEDIRVIQELGASVTLFAEVDITYAVTTALEEYDTDMLVGIGGAPEGVIAAAALKSLGGDFQGKLMPQNEKEYERCINMQIQNPDKILTLEDIVDSSECFFTATGITDGTLLRGVKNEMGTNLKTHSFLSSAGQYRFIESAHVKIVEQPLV